MEVHYGYTANALPYSKLESEKGVKVKVKVLTSNLQLQLQLQLQRSTTYNDSKLRLRTAPALHKGPRGRSKPRRQAIA